MVVNNKTGVFYDMTPYCFVNGYQRLRGISTVSIPWRWRWQVSPKAGIHPPDSTASHPTRESSSIVSFTSRDTLWTEIWVLGFRGVFRLSSKPGFSLSCTFQYTPLCCHRHKTCLEAESVMHKTRERDGPETAVVTFRPTDRVLLSSSNQFFK
jgi:hypothetical protein